jgi:voltage-gated potassium channel
MEVATETRSLRARLYRQLDPRAWPGKGLSPTNKLVCAFILVSSALSILETEPSLSAGRPLVFIGFEWVFALLFGAEYAGRVWTSAESPRYGPGIRGKLKYVRSPAALFDLAVLMSFALSLMGGEAFLLRLVRLLRILRLARLGRFSHALDHVGEAVTARRHELMLSVGIAFILLIVAATMLYLVEGHAQPEAFGSIPRAMWWAVATLTTVGYGDIYPVTALGRVLGGLTAVIGIGLIAMPAGILAAAFGEAMRRRRGEEDDDRPR